MMNKYIIKTHLHHQEWMKVILFLFQVGANSILVSSGSKMIGLDLSRSKIYPKRNYLRLYESLLRHGCQKAFLHVIWAMRYMKLSWHNYIMEMSKHPLSNPSMDKWTNAIKIKWSKWRWTVGLPLRTQSYMRTFRFLNYKTNGTVSIGLNLLQKGAHNRIGSTTKSFSLLLCILS